MVLGNGDFGSEEQRKASELNFGNPNNGDATFDSDQTHRLSEEIDSNCSTPYVSAPSSPGRVPNGYFFSAPASPMHFVLSSSTSSSSSKSVSGFASSSNDAFVSGSFEFEFSARFPSNASTSAGSMISADELFLNGQIRPMKLSSHLQRPQNLAPLLDLEGEDEYDGNKDARGLEFEKREETLVRGRDLRQRSRSLHRRTRSLSPLRNPPLEWHEDEEEREISGRDLELEDPDRKQYETPSTETTPSVSASSSRSSSSGRSSKRWIFLKDLLYRSKSEGRGNSKEKFWSSISFSPVKEKKPPPTDLPLSSSKEKKPSPSVPTTETPKPKRAPQVPVKKSAAAGKPANGVSKRRVPRSPHELHYTTNRAQAEEMKKKTFLPYRQGLLGCLGFSSKSYGAMNGFARTLNPVSSR
ncbi:protein SPT2 homolog [Telopea speciosissima]|uniref:protein SPT2 homolog n=1 Tax=Telopea speciosissima TaxID=54955 RepID=UPI001CC3F9A2|nr:protein SPT2 homolog [Telopea speciosissima]